MLRATQNSEIPAADLGRIRAEDSDRTKMLKDVMKSVAKYASGGLGKGPNESAQAAGQLIMKAMQEEEDEIKRLQLQKEWDPCDRGFLSVEQEGSINCTVAADDDLTEEEIGPEFSELLRHTGTLVKDFSRSLSCSGSLGERPPHIGTTPIDICLISRKEAEDIVAGGATDHKRREQAAWSWVQENVKFKELDKVSRHIDESGTSKSNSGKDSQFSTTGYEDLRKHFDQHHQYHPVLTFLTDHALVDDSIWLGAVHQAMYPPTVETEAAPRAQPSFFAPKALSRTPKGASSRHNIHAAGSQKATNRISFANPGATGLLGSSAGSSGKGFKRNGSSPALR